MKYKVVDAEGNEVTLPAALKDFRGNIEKVVEISRFPNFRSSGRLRNEDGIEYFPSVYDCKIVEVETDEYDYLITYTFVDGFISDEVVTASSWVDACEKLRANHVEEITHFTLVRKGKHEDKG